MIPKEAYFREITLFFKAYFTDKFSLFNNWQKTFKAWLCAEFSLNFMLKPNIDCGYVITTKEDFLTFCYSICWKIWEIWRYHLLFPYTLHGTPGEEKEFELDR